MNNVLHKQMLLLTKFNAQQYIEQLYEKGLLYLNTINYFKTREEDNSLRSDKDEYLTYLFQTKNSIIEINGEDITNKIIGPIKLDNPLDDKCKFTHSFCMSGIFNGDMIREDNKIFDERAREFGNTLIVIFDTTKFLSILQSKLFELQSKGIIEAYDMAPIDYVDEHEYQGKMGCFRKFNKYAWQKEFRLAIAVNNKEPFIFEVGNIKDISRIVDLAQFKNRIETENGQQKLIF